MGIRGSLVIQPVPRLSAHTANEIFPWWFLKWVCPRGVLRLRCHAVEGRRLWRGVAILWLPILRLTLPPRHNPQTIHLLGPAAQFHLLEPSRWIDEDRSESLKRKRGELKWRYYGGPPLEIKLTRATWDGLTTKATGKLIREMKDYELEGVKRVTY